jgi:predicted anti-sigma-YlaC factor YlaD
MTCLTFLDRLANLLDGSATPAERAAAEKHAATCADCAALLRAAGHDRQPRDKHAGTERAPEDLVGPVLARTTGPACRRAEDLLPDYVDGVLEAQTASLLAGHLAHCAACRALAEALRAVGPVLATLAQIEPGPDLLVSVLDATSRRPKPGRVAAWVARWSELLVARPRLSLEAAYVGTVLVVLVFGNPAGTLHAASARTVAAAEAGLGRVKTALPAAISSLPEEKRVADALTTVQDLREKLSASRAALEVRGSGTDQWWSGLAGRLAGAWATVRDGFSWLVAQTDAQASRVRNAVQSLFSRPTEPSRPPGR